MKRRDFLKTTAASTPFLFLPHVPGFPYPRGEADRSLLAETALNTAENLKASYADIRIGLYRTQSVSTREQRVTGISDSESSGFGVRVIVNGTWGFAASHILTVDEVRRITREAVAIARANSQLQKEPVTLAPVKTILATWQTPHKKDPFAVPLKEKTQFLLNLNARALAVQGVTFCSSFMALVRENKFFASSDGSVIEQTLCRCYPTFTVTSVDRARGSFQSRNAYSEPQGLGYEYVEEYPWDNDIRQAAQDVLEKHTAKPVEPGKEILSFIPPTSGSRSMNPSAIPPNWTGHSAWKPTTPEPAFSRRTSWERSGSEAPLSTSWPTRPSPAGLPRAATTMTGCPQKSGTL